MLFNKGIARIKMSKGIKSINFVLLAEYLKYNGIWIDITKE
ncbi:MAG TPA: hypothetical protein VHT34_12810 [Clostridia bacterium]|jgi:hypothetical protein|nr:hypothetical protein [Clostridia bacterium]